MIQLAQFDLHRDDKDSGTNDYVNVKMQNSRVDGNDFFEGFMIG